jgi:hypothetical protein
MPNSQIEMVVKRSGDGREWWDVCGNIELGPGRSSRPVEFLVVVRQGGVVARGHATTSAEDWRFEVVPDGDGQLRVGSAVASAVAIVESDRPPGLETLTWVQRVKVVEHRGADRPFEFPRPELAESKQAVVANDRAVSSSLAVMEEEQPGGFRWEQVLEIRKVVEASG